MKRERKTKSEMIREIHLAMHRARWEHGFFFGQEATQSYTGEQKECRKLNELNARTRELALCELADKIGCSPFFSAWYLRAFDEGKNAKSLLEYRIPVELQEEA